MKPVLKIRTAFSFVIAALLTGCGGSGILSQDRNGGAPDGASASATIAQPDYAAIDWSPQPRRNRAEVQLSMPRLEGLGQRTAPAGLRAQSSAASSERFAGLPPLPDDAARAASVAYTDNADPGAPSLKSANALAAGGKLTLDSEPGEPSWAYFGFPTWATKATQSVTITGSMIQKVNGFKSGIYIALANYSTGRWEFFNNIYNLTLPTALNFKPGANYISPGGNVYVLLASWNGDIAEVTAISTSGDDSNVAPTAALTLSENVGYDGFPTTLDASGSTDSDLTIIRYEFDLGDSLGFVDNGANPVLATTINGIGGKLVTVRVTDEGGLTDEAQVVVISVDPASFLPLSWYRARINAGLGLSTMGLVDIYGGAPRMFPNFFFEGSGEHDGYVDMRTKLPVWFDGAVAAPEAFPGAMNELRLNLDNSTGLQDLLLEANSAYWLQHRISEQNFNPSLDPAQPLAAALATFVTGAGGTANQATYQTAIGTMPIEQQQALARVVLAANSARARRETAMSDIGLPPLAIEALFEQTHGDPTGGLIALDTGSFIPDLYNVTGNNLLLASFPYAAAFFTGAAEIADAVDQLRSFDSTSAPTWASVNLSIATPAGQIVISGTGNDTHAAVMPDGHALLIDLGGEDEYNCHAGANASPLNPVSLCIDLGGDNDVYNAIDDPDDVDRTIAPSNDNTSQQGAGRMGVGMLIDFGGDDEYSSVRLSQGSGVAGVGILADLGGADLYEMEALGQGAAFAGIGILYDADGADIYEGWHKVQGWGGVMGVGLLSDQGTQVNGFFVQPTLDPAKPEYSGWFGLDDDGLNLSLSQGSANGVEIGLLNVGGVPIAGGGGFGICHAASTAPDTFTAGVFAQGSAIYQSTGVLLRSTADDGSQAVAYAQGAAYHAGLACLLDPQGSEANFVFGGPGNGAAERQGIAWALDLDGIDFYSVEAFGLGGSTGNGFGYLVDWLGADSYSSTGAGDENGTLGRARLGGGNADEVGYGLFADDAGTDTYDPDYALMAEISSGTPPADGAFWVRTEDGTYTAGHGSGVDSP